MFASSNERGHRRGRALAIAASAAAVCVLSTLSLAQEARAPMTTGGPATFRRLSEVQYVTAIKDIFGADIKGARPI